jgi:sterol desaturase/sphingolipid hydroxylase (fatty acid hydroxylase superfamily)
MVHDWSKPVDGHPRLFDHSALELLTTAHPRVVVSVYSLMHRYAFHFVPRTRAGVALAYLSHGVHHAYPRDPDRLVMPLIVSAPIAVMLLLAGRAIGGAGAYPFLGGFALGYFAYDLIHYSIHRYDTKSGVLNWLRRYHFQHHFAATDRQFGVSTPIWDYVFRTGR